VSAGELLRWIGATLRRAGWTLLVVLSFWAIAAKGFDAYLRFPWLDMPTHFAGGAAIAYVVDVAARLLGPTVGRVHASVRAALSIGTAAVAAIVWEFAEFLTDLWFGSHLNLGVSDTLSDLFFGLAGATVFCAARLVYWQASGRRDD
jgi:hypothetical protein